MNMENRVYWLAIWDKDRKYSKIDNLTAKERVEIAKKLVEEGCYVIGRGGGHDFRVHYNDIYGNGEEELIAEPKVEYKSSIEDLSF